MIRVVILGSGNLAQHVTLAFANSKIVNVIQVYARKKESVSFFPKEKVTNKISEIKDADLYIISVSDQAISKVSNTLQLENKLVVHTSGSIDISVINNKNRKGVFYPLQTFSKNKELSFLNIPICIEAENLNDFKLLETIAKSISNQVYSINSEQRKALHVSAVFVNNFTNHMYKIGHDICIQNNIPFQILQSLITETANKISLLSPNEAQTGPAKRNDTATINSHLQFLTDENQKEIYKLLTKSIIDNGKKL